MFTIRAENVNEAFFLGIRFFKSNEGGYYRRIAPRGRETLEATGPVITMYAFPRERVLFDRTRRANPFFHFMESLWILAGRNDVDWISQFNSNIANYANGTTFHGAYGYRLRRLNGDQIPALVNLLKKDPDTRQAVLQIWDARLDLNNPSMNDIPCNDLVFFKIRDDRLHMTVCCRSNDMIWGAYGANAVHFSYLQEFIAGQLGLRVGAYHQVSDSFHVYTDNPTWMAFSESSVDPNVSDPYRTGMIRPYSSYIGSGLSVPQFTAEVRRFIRFAIMDGTIDGTITALSDPVLTGVAVPMLRAWAAWKKGRVQDALHFCNNIEALDWSQACFEWISDMNKLKTEKKEKEGAA